MRVHEEILQRLLRARSKGQLGHTVLLRGGGGHGAYELAVALAQALLCPSDSGPDECEACRKVRRFVHPDFLCLSPLPTLSERSGAKDELDPIPRALAEDLYAPFEVGANWGITAEQARRMIQWVAMTPWEARGKVVLIAEAEKVTEPTADIMLKTLEEPPEGVTILLVSGKPHDLLPTVRSRCHHVRVPPLPDEHILALLVERGIAEEDAQAVLPLAGGDFWLAWALAGQGVDRLRRTAGELLHAALDPSRRTADVIAETRKALEGASAGEVSELVRWIIWWLRDLLLVETGAAPARQEMEQVVPLAKRLGHARLMRWMDEADRAYEMLGRNVTPQAVVTALLLFPRDERRMEAVWTFPSIAR